MPGHECHPCTRVGPPLLRPVDGGDSTPRRRVFVFTQERLHILLSSHPNLPARALIVDEAHKVGDRQRGVLLQDVIERLSAANVHLHALFASPMTSNPGTLLTDARPEVNTGSFVSENVTVTQNLFWVSQRTKRPTIWDISLCIRGAGLKLGFVTLGAKPSNDSKRLSFIAHAVGGAAPGNIVYVNGAAEAEKIAAQLFDLIGADVDGDSAESLRDLVELSQHVVHKKFALATCLRRGVAFHYGNMPLLIREAIENLFTNGVIKYLVCTSTLIEGVNMSCRNIFMRGPTKGRSNLLHAEDFWNLAGRAGRWGKEFQGNIFCIDPERKDLWGSDGPPRERTQQPIRRTTDDALAAPSDIASFIKQRAPLTTAQEFPELEYVFPYLAGIHVRCGGLLQAPWARRFQPDALVNLAHEVAQAVDGLSISPDTIVRNPGISPFALDDLLRNFRERDGNVEDLMPADPSSTDAARVYAAIFGRLCKRACPKLGPEGGRAFMLALLVTHWMRGYPLSRLIEERIKYQERKGTATDDVSAAIRTVMNEVEQIARFEAPRGLSAYCDVLRQHLREVGRDDLIEHLLPFDVMLELGVSQQTQMSLIGIGLTRTSAISLSELIASDSLTESQTLRWLADNAEVWRNFSLPVLVKKEVQRVLAQHTRS